MTQHFEQIEAHPLHWPAHWPRSGNPESAAFKTQFSKARDGLVHELELLGAERLIISSNLMLRLDGLPLSKQRQPADAGIAVYFVLDGDAQCIPCDKWAKVEDNLQAVRLTVEALRGLERWGAKNMVKAAFSGFKAIPETTSGRGWWDVLQMRKEGGIAIAETQYKRLALDYHPDKPNGSHDKMSNLNLAIDQARCELG